MQHCWLSLSTPLPRAVGMGPWGFLRTQNNSRHEASQGSFKAWGISQREQSLPEIQKQSMDNLLPRRTQGSAQVLGWFSLFCRWIHHTQPPQQILKPHFLVPSTAEETKLDIYFRGEKKLCFMSGITDDVFCGGYSDVFTSPFQFCFSEDLAVPLKKRKGEGMSQVIYFFNSKNWSLADKKEKTFFFLFLWKSRITKTRRNWVTVFPSVIHRWAKKPPPVIEDGIQLNQIWWQYFIGGFWRYPR